MRFALDLIFLDRDLGVVRIVRRVPPWRIVAGGRAAWGVVEVQTGWLGEDAIRVGDRLSLVPSA